MVDSAVVDTPRPCLLALSGLDRSARLRALVAMAADSVEVSVDEEDPGEVSVTEASVLVAALVTRVVAMDSVDSLRQMRPLVLAVVVAAASAAGSIVSLGE